jgi:hypothetical protein
MPAERFTDKPGAKILTPCATCKHRNADGFSCKAFVRIPQEILLGKVDHRTPVAGDNGIHWELRSVN